MSEPEVTKIGLFHMQVCVPKEWSDDEIEEFANGAHLCGTSKGWTVTCLENAEERVDCEERGDCCH